MVVLLCHINLTNKLWVDCSLDWNIVRRTTLPNYVFFELTFEIHLIWNSLRVPEYKANVRHWLGSSNVSLAIKDPLSRIAPGRLINAIIPLWKNNTVIKSFHYVLNINFSHGKILINYVHMCIIKQLK